MHAMLSVPLHACASLAGGFCLASIGHLGRLAASEREADRSGLHAAPSAFCFGLKLGRFTMPSGSLSPAEMEGNPKGTGGGGAQLGHRLEALAGQ